MNNTPYSVVCMKKPDAEREKGEGMPGPPDQAEPIILSFLQPGAFKNLHVLLQKRRMDTQGRQTQIHFYNV